jgi:hypothetical protein
VPLASGPRHWCQLASRPDEKSSALPDDANNQTNTAIIINFCIGMLGMKISFPDARCAFKQNRSRLHITDIVRLSNNT